MDHLLRPRINPLAALEALVFFKQASINDPPDTTGRLEGQFLAPIPDVLAVMAELVKNEFMTIYAYKTYANSLRGMAHHSLAEEFEQHADEESDHADFLLRRMAVLGGPVNVPEIPAPPPATKPEEIVQTLIRVEQEGIAGWRQLKEMVGENNPMYVTIEEYMAKEQEHLDDLWQLMPYEAQTQQISKQASPQTSYGKKLIDFLGGAAAAPIVPGIVGMAGLLNKIPEGLDVPRHVLTGYAAGSLGIPALGMLGAYRHGKSKREDEVKALQLELDNMKRMQEQNAPSSMATNDQGGFEGQGSNLKFAEEQPHGNILNRIGGFFGRNPTVLGALATAASGAQLANSAVPRSADWQTKLMATVGGATLGAITGAAAAEVRQGMNATQLARTGLKVETPFGSTSETGKHLLLQGARSAFAKTANEDPQQWLLNERMQNALQERNEVELYRIQKEQAEQQAAQASQQAQESAAQAQQLQQQVESHTQQMQGVLQQAQMQQQMATQNVQSAVQMANQSATDAMQANQKALQTQQIAVNARSAVQNMRQALMDMASQDPMAGMEQQLQAAGQPAISPMPTAGAGNPAVDPAALQQQQAQEQQMMAEQQAAPQQGAAKTASVEIPAELKDKLKEGLKAVIPPLGGAAFGFALSKTAPVSQKLREMEAKYQEEGSGTLAKAIANMASGLEAMQANPKATVMSGVGLGTAVGQLHRQYKEHRHFADTSDKAFNLANNPPTASFQMR